MVAIRGQRRENWMTTMIAINGVCTCKTFILFSDVLNWSALYPKFYMSVLLHPSTFEWKFLKKTNV